VCIAKVSDFGKKPNPLERVDRRTAAM